MSREHFHEQLERVELELLSMGELASSAGPTLGRGAGPARAPRPPKRSSATTTRSTIYLLDSGVLEMLALQSPAWLRLAVSAILHSCLHLERIGDQAVNIAKLFLTTRTCRPVRPSSAARRDGRLRGHHDPNRDGGVADARPRALPKLPKMDDPVDRLNRGTHLEALKLAEDPRALDWGSHEPRGTSPRTGRRQRGRHRGAGRVPDHR